MRFYTWTRPAVNGVIFHMTSQHGRPYILFRARSAIGEFKELLDSLVAQVRFQEGQVPEPSVAVVDAQSVRAASYPSPKGFGR